MSTTDLSTKPNAAELQSEFDAAFVELFSASSEIDPFAVYTIKRLDEESGLDIAKRILLGTGQQTGLMRLWQQDRLDLSVEMLALRPEFSALFSSKELEAARERLSALGFSPD
jgi:hypothetical protein